MVHVFYISLILAEIVDKDFDKVGVLICGILGLVYLIIDGRRIVYFPELWYLIFTIYLAFAAVYYVNAWNALMYSLYFLLQYGVLNYFVVKNNNNNLYLIRSVVIFLYWQTAVAAIAVIDFTLYQYGVISVIRDYLVSWKSDSFYSNPNPLGIISAIVLVIMLGGYSRRVKHKKTIFVINALAVAVSGSSMAIGLVFVYAVYLVLLNARALILLSFVILLPVLLIVLVITLDLSVTYDVENLFNKRLEIWGHGLRMWESSPFVGIGTGNFQILSLTQDGSTVFAGKYGMHSLYMWLIVETGVIGSILFFMFVFSFMITRNNRNVKQFVLPVFVILMISQISEFYLDHEEIYILVFWMVVATGLSRGHVKKSAIML